MNGGMSKTASDLLRAAKADAPAPSARADMWKGIEQTVAGSAVTTAVTSTGTAAAGGASAKAAFIGALVGSAAAVGVVAIVLHLSAAKLTATSAPTALERRASVADERFDPPSAMMALRQASRAGEEPTHPAADPPVVRSAPLDARTREDVLSREAALVTSGRHQLLAGNAEGALRDVAAARALPVRQLEPEVLTLEARALRALGRDDEAATSEVTLRLRYPSRAPR